MASLAGLHLAELHQRAAELGIPGYRMLRRDELVDEISRREGAEPPAEPAPEPEPEIAPKPEAEIAPELEAEIAPEPEPEPVPEPAREPEEPPEPVAGVLELTGSGHGFLRTRGLEPSDDDVYVSASQIRRCELRVGDQVSGPARAPRRGERHRALVHIDLVNGAEPEAEGRPDLSDLVPVPPRRRLALAIERDDVLLRAVDLLAPLAFGQRVLVSTAPRSGRTTLLRGLARAVLGAGAAEAIVLLVDERPEEAAGWREAAGEAVLALATAEMAPANQVRVAALAAERARRRVEAGGDVVLICDSLSRLAVAAGGTVEVKRLFGSGREIEGEGNGSLTVIATTVAGAADDGAAERAVVTTENAIITLDPELAAVGVFPALKPAGCRVSREEDLRSADELAAVRRLRAELAELGPAEAAQLLRERIASSADNAELLAALPSRG
jgi:transcription termination factor Rho